MAGKEHRRMRQEDKPKRPLGLYIHIPFCMSKCRYCDFLSAPPKGNETERYVEALCREIRGYAETAENYLVETVYFGGGTPSILKEEQTKQIILAIRDTFEIRGMRQKAVNKKPFRLFGIRKEEKTEAIEEEPAEITIEVNPGTVTAQKLTAYAQMGFNRLSVGAQSAQSKELELLGRRHSFEEVKECVRMAREAGFANLSIDVISSLPGQKLEEYEATLDEIIRLQPEHISSYSLIVEEGTPFYELYGEGAELEHELADEETDRAMYALTGEKLAKAGYVRYEISNYAKPGYESRHNSSYWTGTEYLGFGLGASSLFTNARYHNEEKLEEYISCINKKEEVRRDLERLVEAEVMEEYMILGLRMMKGVSREEFMRRFGRPLETVYGSAIHKLEELGLLTVKGDNIALTKQGIDVSNQVFVEFVPEEFVRR